MRFFPIDQWSALAGLRFFLALVVAVTHLKPSFTESQGCLSWIFSCGAFEAIVGFLVISGYSVGGSFIREPKGFLQRRFLRIYPVYFFSILFTGAVSYWSLGKALPSWHVIGFNLCFLNQVFTTGSFVGPSWTLALEVWLYCLCPLLLRCSPKRLRLLCILSFCCYALYTIFRSAFHLPYYAGLGGGLNLIFLSYAWVVGLRIADPRSNRSVALRDLLLLSIMIPSVEMMVQIISHARHHEWTSFLSGDLLTSAHHLSLLLIVWAFFCIPFMPSKTGTASLILRFFGDVSYPLYLLHYWIFAYLASKGCHNPLLLTLGAIVFSALVYICIDRYSQRRHLRIISTP